MSRRVIIIIIIRSREKFAGSERTTIVRREGGGRYTNAKTYTVVGGARAEELGGDLTPRYPTLCRAYPGGRGGRGDSGTLRRTRAKL